MSRTAIHEEHLEKTDENYNSAKARALQAINELGKDDKMIIVIGRENGFDDGGERKGNTMAIIMADNLFVLNTISSMADAIGVPHEALPMALLLADSKAQKKKKEEEE